MVHKTKKRDHKGLRFRSYPSQWQRKKNGEDIKFYVDIVIFAFTVEIAIGSCDPFNTIPTLSLTNSCCDVLVAWFVFIYAFIVEL